MSVKQGDTFKDHIVPGYQWIVIDKQLLGGQPVIRGTRISVAHILECLAGGMSFTEITEESGVPGESFSEALCFAASIAGDPTRVAS